MVNVICDLCGKKIEDDEPFARYRVEKRRWNRFLGWVDKGYIDCHDECAGLIAEMIEKKRTEDKA